MRKIKHVLTDEMQIVLNILFLCTLFIIFFAYPSFAQQNVEQKTTGNQSPNINASGGNITIKYGISEESLNEFQKLFKGKNKKKDEIIDRLLKNLDEKDVKIGERDAVIKDWIKKYKELEQRLVQRPSEDNLSAQARQKLANGDMEGAEKLLHESLEKNLQDIKGKTKAAAADAYEIGSLKQLQLDYRNAREYYYQAVQLAPDVSDYLSGYGSILVILGDSKKAVEYYEKALKIDIAVYGDNHPNVAIRYSNLGTAWDHLGDFKKAVEYYEKALKINLAVYGNKHPNIAAIYNNLGTAWDNLGDFKKAVEYYEKALKIDITVFGDKHPNFAIIYSSLGTAWYHLGDSKKAVEYYEKALKIDIAVFGDKHPDVAIIYNSLGLAWEHLGDSKKAVEYYEKALKIDLAVYGDKHPDVAVMYSNIGSAWDHLGDSKKAVEYYEKALTLSYQVYGADHPLTKTIKMNINNMNKQK